MTTELRRLSPSDWDEWYECLDRAFGGVESPEERKLYRDLTEFDRSIGVWDGDEVVGTAGAFTFRMTVPGGGLLPTAGVTMVSAEPTHRRRGVLTQMMRRLTDDIRAAGEPLAVLTASEPAIYGRFGYGIATYQGRADIDTARVRLTVPEGTDDVRLRRASPEDALEKCEALYARRVATRPGMLARQPGWERMPLHDPAGERDGASPLRCVLAEVGGETVGYVRYAVRPEWDAAGPKGHVVLHDMEALDPTAYAALWRYLFGIDLTSTIVVRNRPVDDAWQYMVSDLRRCMVTVRDSLYVRLIDIGGALAARTYRTPVDVVLDVADPYCPWNEGRWRLTGDPKGASCERTDDAPDLTLSVRELGSVYLGGVGLDSLAGAGRVRELRQGALAEAAAAFGSDVAPWLPHGF